MEWSFFCSIKYHFTANANGNVISVSYDYNFAITTLVSNLYLLHCYGLWAINYFVSIFRTKKY